MTMQQRLTQLENENGFEIMSKDDFMNYMLELNLGHTYGSIITANAPKMNVRGNPFRDRVIKLSKWNFGCFTSFKTKGTNIREKSGIEGEFNPHQSYVTADNGEENFVVCTKKDDPTKKYLRLYTNPESKTVTFSEYYVDGVKASEFELEQIRTFIKKTSKGSHNLGIIGDKAFGTFNQSLDNVKYIFINNRKIKIV